MKIKRMEREELSQIQYLYKELVPDGCSMKALEENFLRTSERPEYILLTAKEGERVAGTAIGVICVALDTPFLVVENVVVDEEFRGRGIGRKIFEKLDEFARENNCAYALLVSSGFRKDAHAFYEAIGYNDDVRGFRKYYK